MSSVNCDDRRTVEHKIVSLVQKIDLIHSSATCVGAIFSPEAITIRSKLQQYCLTVCLNIESSNESTRKAEESIWRKLFHNVVHSYKSLKSRQPAQVEIDLVRNHLIAGIGFYSNLIQMIASSSQLNLQILDHLQVYDENLFNLSHDKPPSVDVKMDETRARQSILRSLIYLGDICRYLDDLKWPSSRSLAIYRYNNALLWDPTCGMPHNQLATLFSGVNYDVDSCYHYLRCITSEKPFDGAEANLKRLLSRCIFVPVHSMNRLRANIGQSSSKDDNIVKKTVDLFLSIAYSLLHSSQQNTPFSDILDEFTHTYLVSSGTVDEHKKNSHELTSLTEGTSGSKRKVINQVSSTCTSLQGYLGNDITFKIAMMSLMILMKCPSFAKPNALALVVNFYFTLIAHCEKKCKEIVQKITLKSQRDETNGSTGKLMKNESSSDSPERRRRRRNVDIKRRRQKIKHEDCSDESYPESDESEALLEKIALRTIDALEITSDVSDEDVHDDLLSSDEKEDDETQEEEEEEEEEESENNDDDKVSHTRVTKSQDVIESDKSILCGKFYTESPLATLKVYCDWIAANRYLFDSLAKVDFQGSICFDLAKILDSVVSHETGELADGVRKDSCHPSEQQQQQQQQQQPAPKFLSIDLALVKFPLLPQSHSFDASRPCLSNSQAGYLCASSVLNFITNSTHSL